MPATQVLPSPKPRDQLFQLPSPLLPLLSLSFSIVTSALNHHQPTLEDLFGLSSSAFLSFLPQPSFSTPLHKDFYSRHSQQTSDLTFSSPKDSLAKCLEEEAPLFTLLGFLLVLAPETLLTSSRGTETRPTRYLEITPFSRSIDYPPRVLSLLLLLPARISLLSTPNCTSPSFVSSSNR